MLKEKFWYFIGKDNEKKLIRGIIDAPNKSIARYKLFKLNLNKINCIILSFSSYKKIFYLNNKEKLHFFSNMSIQIHAGLSIFDSIESIMSDANIFKIKYLLSIILKNLHEGHGFSRSLEKLAHPVFSKIELGLIKASEISGSLDVMLKFICEKLEGKLLIKQKLVSTLIYPVITLIVSFFVTLIIFKWVIPQFEMIFSKNHYTLPWITECIFLFSKNINTILYMSAILSTAFCLAIQLLIKHRPLSKKLIDAGYLKIPIIGKILILTNRIDFCYTLSMLLGAGVPLHHALHESIQHVSLSNAQERLKQAYKEVVLGKNLSSTLKNTRFFPYSSIQTIAAAENTGRLDQAFKIIAQQFINELSVFSDHLSHFIEPFIIILLGGMIGTIVIAIYLPILQLGNLY